VCAIIGITNECKIMQVKTQQLLLRSGNQVNDNVFRPLYLFSIRPSSGQILVTKEEFYNSYSILQCNVDLDEISFCLTNIQVCVYVVNNGSDTSLKCIR
jgi:hypothetical protein